MVLFSVGLGIVAILLDIFVGRHSPATLAAIFIGVIVGGIFAFFVANAVSLFFPDFNDASYALAVKIIAWVILTYLSITVILQTKDNFRFVIPYVEFYRQTRGEKPILLDTSAIIDGRIADLAETGILESTLIVPSFVLSELQAVADSSVRTRRLRGRRGLDILARLKGSESVDVKVLDTAATAEPVDQRLVKLAKSLDGRIVTTDFNLNKTARLQGIKVMNLNDMANALKPVVVPGETLSLSIIKEGEEPAQGVGYLDDGTMVVVEGGRSRIGKTVNIAVTSVLQTSAGRMIFGKLEG
ncbi:MAG: TRAM domain-containing protein [Planctomycetes bacterium]|nr:TRAM domain-containing protein [Planctomycetota bacterium]